MSRINKMVFDYDLCNEIIINLKKMEKDLEEVINYFKQINNDSFQNCIGISFDMLKNNQNQQLKNLEICRNELAILIKKYETTKNLFLENDINIMNDLL